MNTTRPSTGESILPSSNPAGNSGKESRTTNDLSLSGPVCFRICGIPSEWTKRELEEALYTIDPALPLMKFRLSTLFPACCNSSQIALLTIERCTEYLRFSDPDHEKFYIFPADDNSKDVRLRIDKHFYDLTPLNAPGEPILADVIAITGLGGHAFGSWRSRACPDGYPLDRQMWLRDFLPGQYPQIRIMTYGYNSSLVKPNGFTLDDHTKSFIQSIKNSRRNCPERPIIFIGHSLGGIVVAKVLIEWANDRSPDTPFKCIRGVFFFGTPHNGMRVEELKHTFTGKGQYDKIQGILAQLEESSDFLQKQRDKLTAALSVFEGRIFTFFETEMTNSVQELEPGVFKRSGDPFQMVKRTSAILSMPNESHFAIMSDHTNMVKFKSPDDKVFQDVVTCMHTCFAQRVDVLKYLEKNMRPEKHPYYLDQSRYFEGYLESEEPADCFLALRSMDYMNWVSETGRVQLLVYKDFPSSNLLAPCVLKNLRNNEKSSTLLYFCRRPAGGGSSAQKVTAQIVLTFFCQAILVHPEDTRGSLLHQFLDILLTSLEDEHVILIQSGDVRNAFASIADLSDIDTLWSALAQALMGSAGPHRGLLLGEQGHTKRNYKIILDVNGPTEPYWDEIILKLRQLLSPLPVGGFLAAKLLVIDSLNVLDTSGPSWLSEVVVHYDKERGECLDSLHFENPRYDKIAKHHTHTLAWLWESSKYKSWISVNYQGSSMIFIEGKPGSGKSTLVRYFVDHFTPPTDAIVAKFFYSARDGESETDHRNMLKAVLYKILKEDQSFFIHFQYFYRRNGGIEWSSKDMKDILLACKLHPRRRNIYLIIDAMDESICTDRADIVRFLHELSVPNDSVTGCVIKVFLASRPINELQLTRWDWRCEILLQEMNRPDIERYTRNLLENEEFSSIAVEIKQEITDYILRFSDGVFLWVFLVLKELAEFAMNGVRKSTLMRFLKSLPKSLESIYECMLHRLVGNMPQAKVDGRRTLQFCLFSHRAINLVELEHALAIPGLQDGEVDYRDWEGEIPHDICRYLIHCVGGFVDIKGSENLLQVVQIMHQTVREFFFRPSEVVRISHLDISDPQDARNMMQLTCVRFLEIVVKESCQFTFHAPDIRRYIEYLETRPFIRYSLEYLKQNKRHIAPQIEGRLSQLSYNFRGSHYSLTGVLLNELLSLYTPRPDNLQIESYLDRLILDAASNGYFIATRNLLAASANIRAKNTENQTLLHLAARGHYEVTKLLLDSYNADLESKDIKGMTVLHHAAEYGCEAVVELFLKRGVKVDAKDSSGRTALHYASENGHDGAIQLLLSNNADIYACDDRGRTALHYASENGHDRAVQILLSNNANVYAFDHRGRTALHRAAMKGQDSVVRILSTKKNVKDVRDYNGCAALHYASENGHDSTVQLLLSNNADVYARDNTGCTALHYASRNGHDGAVQLLLSNNANVFALDKRGRTALHYASENGHDRVVQLLLSRNANVNAHDLRGRTELHYASENGHDSTIQLLLSSNANIKARDDRGRTALHYASENGHDGAVQLLLCNNADVNVRDDKGHTALHLATIKRQDSTVRILSAKRTAIDAKDGDGSTALNYAYGHRHDTVAQLPLAPNWNQHSRDESGSIADYYTGSWTL